MGESLPAPERDPPFGVRRYPGPVRFGPRPIVFVLPLVAAALVAVFLLVTPSFYLVVAAAVLVLASLPGWNWFVVAHDGIYRVGLAGSKHVPWEAVDGVIGMRVSGPRGAGAAVFQYVVDEAGRRLLPLSPWIRRRRDMVRLVVMTASERRKAGAQGAR